MLHRGAYLSDPRRNQLAQLFSGFFSEPTKRTAVPADKKQIRELCRDYPVIITEYTFSDEDVTQAYKQYVMDAGVFSQLITSDIPFSDLLMDTTGFYWNQPYSWIVPLQDGKYAYTVPSSEQEGG